MLALIDGDIIVYRSAFAAEHVRYDVHRVAAYKGDEPWWEKVYEAKTKKEAEQWIAEHGDGQEMEVQRRKILDKVEVARMAAKATMESILDKLQINEFRLFLSGSENYRKEVATIKGYKAHRPPKPVYYTEVRDYLFKYWKAELIDGIEADDKLGIEQYQNLRRLGDPEFGLTYVKPEGFHHTVICSIDKDLKMIPGWHYNFVKDERVWVNELEGYRNFYKQCITGDSTDNIPGLFAITGTKATKAVLAPLEKATSIEEMSRYVAGIYSGHEAELEEVAELLWILREPRDEA